LVRFGHDGWLGQLARDITFDSIEAVASAAGLVMVEDYADDARLVVGYDRRFLSDLFARAIARNLAALGVDIWLVPRPIALPILSYAIRRVDVVGGIMVTGGSNRADMNGLRLRGWDGAALPRWMLDRVESLSTNPAALQRIGPTGTIHELDPVDDYLDSISRFVSLSNIRSSGITVAIDAMWGAGSEMLPQLIDGDGSRSVEIRTAHNPLFPELGTPRPIPENLERLRRIVRNGDAAAGIAISADGSAVGLLDELGVPVGSGALSALIAWYLYYYKRWSGAMGRTIVSSTMIDLIAANAGERIHETPFGYTATSEALREQMPRLFGDENGGLIYSDHLLERDGLLTGLFIVEALVRTEMTLSEMLDEMRSITGIRRLERFTLPLTSEQSELVQSRLKRREWPNQIGELQVREVYQTDGVKFEVADDAWLVLRFDEIDGVLQIVAEAPEIEQARTLIQSGQDLMFV
jgi:phosphomannomutase